MTGQISSKKQIIELIRDEQTAFEATLAQLTEAQMTRPTLEGNWSVKDTLAHLAAWQQRMVQWIEESLRGEVPERPAPGEAWDNLDELNDRIYSAHKDRPLAEVLADFRQACRQAMATVEGLSEADLLEPGRFAWRRGYPMWQLVAANTWEHYQEHRQAITDWLEKEK